MKPFLLRMTISLLFISATFSGKTEAKFGQWCVADPQLPDDVIQAALDWACNQGGADCSKIQPNKPCFLPNTIKGHASVVFNDYYQRFKHQGGTCYFHSAAFVTQDDPSHGSCKFEYIPDSKERARMP